MALDLKGAALLCLAFSWYGSRKDKVVIKVRDDGSLDLVIPERIDNISGFKTLSVEGRMWTLPRMMDRWWCHSRRWGPWEKTILGWDRMG